MTVRELIAVLAKHPPQALVLLQNVYSPGHLFIQVTEASPLLVCVENGQVARYSAAKLEDRNNAAAVVLG